MRFILIVFILLFTINSQAQIDTCNFVFPKKYVFDCYWSSITVKLAYFPNRKKYAIKIDDYRGKFNDAENALFLKWDHGDFFNAIYQSSEDMPIYRYRIRDIGYEDVFDDSCKAKAAFLIFKHYQDSLVFTQREDIRYTDSSERNRLLDEKFVEIPPEPIIPKKKKK